MGIRKMIAALTAAVITAGCVLSAPSEAASLLDRQYDRKLTLVTQALRSDAETLEAAETVGATVFLSVSDGKTKARVASASADDIDEAIDTAYKKLGSFGIFPKWFKLDVVTSVTECTYKKFKESFKDALIGSMRYGVSFGDSSFTRALLDPQINSGGMLNYETGDFSWKRVNKELARSGMEKLVNVPKKLYLFKTQGYFAENSACAYRLTSGQYNDTGRRASGTDRASIEALAAKSSGYLSTICDQTGKFVYGYYPIDNEEISGYNTLRHAGTVWNLVMQYEMTGDERLVPVIKSALAYLKNTVVYKDPSTAFVADGSYLNIGGNGIALLAFCTYASVFGSQKYNSLIRALANGVIFMQKPDGSFTHMLDAKTYQTAKDYVIIYYDGEASYGLLKAYEILGQDKYLNAARRAADCFIANNYEDLNSHWISYLFNELTKYIPEEKYFEFGLKNVMTNNYLNKLYRSRSSKNSSNETINAVFELYDRLISGGYECAYLEQFDAQLLLKTMHKRAEYGLNYFMFPEYAMYFEAPDAIANSFAVREDNFRIRIDDIQHFMDGYYLYWKNYDRIMQYTNTEQNKAA
ncbi:MAG: hypothetical protein K5876_03055 [Ruminiclostridium sp.]|nr:hypothetical protein [Ruminiclostridium sp.]